MSKKKIVIVGGGFAGIKLALRLSKQDQFSVSLISDNNFFEYHAALYRSATGWSPSEVVLPLNNIFPKNSNIKIVRDTITGIDSTHLRIKGKSGRTYKYDELIMCIGQIVNYYDIEGMKKNSYNLNSILNSFKLREHLEQIVIDYHKDFKKKEFVIIGGGATGVELASEIHFYLDKICGCDTMPAKKIQVTLIEAGSRLLPLLSPKASKYAEWRMEKIGVHLKLNTRVERLEKNILSTQKGQITSDTVIWTAGFTNHKLFSQHPKIFRIARNSKVEVNEYLEADEHIYVIGDNANTKYSGMAQTALSDAVFVEKNLIRMSKSKKRLLYSPHQPIYAVPVGLNYAILQWGSIVLRGRFAWIIRRLADLRLFITFEPYKKAIHTWRAGNKHEKKLDIKISRNLKKQLKKKSKTR